MDQETALRLEEKLDRIIEALPTIDALGAVLIQRKTVNERTGINKNTISNNAKIEKFEEIGHRRTFIQIGDVPVVKQRKKHPKR